MNRATHQMRSIALRLINYETPGNDSFRDNKHRDLSGDRPAASASGDADGKWRVSRPTRPRARAGSAEVSWLRAVQVNADGTLDGLALP